ncbi:excisionase family DNA binding protein [Deinobacterium chartae]|uniref:Excisionase family DNA binding protein n=1 Tax=Deinobacterium chartae TaxID=521158 RepID=A0A841I049_9DEIO|nr:helix-turn-helix domain-containing protein [Deinobacterium chartae]MBB6099161.1 excisionase family DNA binding protein [Deinobacterium chartae]
MDDLMTLEEAARALCVSESRVMRLVRTHKLEAVRHGRLTLVKRESVAARATTRPHPPQAMAAYHLAGRALAYYRNGVPLSMPREMYVTPDQQADLEAREWLAREITALALDLLSAVNTHHYERIDALLTRWQAVLDEYEFRRPSGLGGVDLEVLTPEAGDPDL